jgi:hypothetical protein
VFDWQKFDRLSHPHSKASKMTSYQVYKVDCFKELCTIYPTWSELRAFLDKEHMLIKYETQAETSRHCIIHYNKKVDSSSELAKGWKRWFRSVVWDTETNRPVCVAVSKASEGEPVGDCVEQEYLDGFMINSWTDSSGKTTIATRSSIGATGTFHSKKTFATLFQEAFDKSIVQVVNPSHTFTSYIVQHPENRCVSPVSEPKLYIIHSGFVDADGTVTIVENNNLPKAVEEPTWKVQGKVYKDGKGNRWRVRNPAYEMVKHLRGNDARPDVRYIRLRQQKLVDTYLYYYPEDKEKFVEYENKIKLLIQDLYDLYVKVHIRKEVKLEEIEDIYRPHVYALHGYYLSTLKSVGFFIRNKEVTDYINKLPWQRLVFLMTRA